jgi:hypothetical protein
VLAPTVLGLLALVDHRPAWGQGTPEARAHHQVVYHAGDERAYLIGGSTRRGDGYHFFDDVWSWDGVDWTHVGSLPSSRSSHGVVYHNGRNSLVLFGGGSGWDATNQFSGATWEWIEGRFVDAHAAGPARRAGHALVYDAVRERCLLFGGRSEAGYLADTWEWDGRAWRQLEVSGPSARWFFGAATDDANRRIVIFGGKPRGHVAA